MHSLLLALVLGAVRPQAPPAQPQAIDYHLNARGPKWVHEQAKVINVARSEAIKAHK